MTRKIIPLLAALSLISCASQPEPPAPRPGFHGATRTLQDLNGSRIAMPLGLVLAGMDLDRDARVSRSEVSEGAGESFEASDGDADGYLRPLEFMAWSRTNLGSEYGTPGPLQLDHDQDGWISRDEFTATFAEIHSRLDRDRDGALVRAELLVEVNGAGLDPAAVRAQIEAEMRRNMQGRVRDMCRRGGRGM